MKIINDLNAGFIQSVYLEGAILVLNSDLMLTRAHAHPELISILDTLSQLSEQLCMSHQTLNVN